MTGLLAVAGFASLVTNQLACSLYIGVSSCFLITVSIGGLIEYNSQHMRDFREVYREKYRMRDEEKERMRELITKLKEEIETIGSTKHPEKEGGVKGGCRANFACCGEQ